MRGEAGEPDQAESLDDACMNDLSVLKAVLTLLSYPAAAVGGEEDKQLLGRRWVRGERRDFLTGVELGVDGWRQDTVGEGGEKRDCLGILGTSCLFCLMGFRLSTSCMALSIPLFREKLICLPHQPLS